MSDMRVVAVTGATGFLGLHLVAALARQGAHVRILTRRDPVHDLWRDLALDVVPGGLESASALEHLVIGADTVVHGAGLIKAQNRAQFMRTNRDGTRAIAEATGRYAPNARFVAISSLAAREPQLSDYAASKRAGEDAARAAFAGMPQNLVIVRPPAIYGPWDRETLAIFKAAAQPVVPLFGNGRAAIVHVAAAAAALARLAMGEGEAGLYALSDSRPEGYTMRELLGAAAQAMGTHPRFLSLPDGVLTTAGRASEWWGRLTGIAPIFTTGKAREMLHADWSVSAAERLPAAFYQENIGILPGFHETVEWYRKAKWLA
jgi:nucleoside-diphosphate-sugar epimerase